MLRELIISTMASLIASGITGFLGQKAIKNFNSVILKAYVLFLSVIVFITSELFAFVICSTMMNKAMTAYDVERLYRFLSGSLVFVVLLVVLVTAGVIIVEASHRSDLIDMKKTDEIE